MNNSSQVNILIVDDRPENLLALEAVLEPLGVNLLSARSGEAALQLARIHDFAAVLLDVQMPVMDGFETAGRLRELERAHQVPILFLTATEADDGRIARAYALGAVDYVLKPFSPDVMRSKVTGYISLFERTRRMQARLQTAADAEGGVNILVVNDGLAGMLSTEVSLARLGKQARVLTARSGREALSLLLKHRFGLVMLDVHLPDMDGFELATLLKQNDRCRDIPLVFITAAAQAEADVTRGYAAGAVDFLFMPIEPEVLRARVKALLDQFWQQRTLTLYVDEITQLNHELSVAARELERANEELKRLSEAKSEFVASVSHDLRTPLTTIIEGIALNEDGTLGPVNDKQKKFLGLAREEAERLSGMVNDILDVAKIEAGKVLPDRTKVDVAGMVDRVRRNFDTLAIKKGLHLKVELPEQLPPVLCDAEHYDRILTNLLSNAVKFTPADGTVCVRAAKGPQGQVVTSVSDTGIGIPRDQRSRVFGRFEQVRRPVVSSAAGSGLGLSLCKDLVQLNGGTIGFESEAGRGSTFHFSLPVYDEIADLRSALSVVAQHAQSVSGQPSVFLFDWRPDPEDPGQPETVLARIAEAIRPKTLAIDELRTFVEHRAVVLISVLPEGSVQPVFDDLVQSVRETGIRQVFATFQVCVPPLPDADALLAALKAQSVAIDRGGVRSPPGAGLGTGTNRKP
jgi:signal transduction histidine kinase